MKMLKEVEVIQRGDVELLEELINSISTIEFFFNNRIIRRVKVSKDDDLAVLKEIAENPMKEFKIVKYESGIGDEGWVLSCGGGLYIRYLF